MGQEPARGREDPAVVWRLNSSDYGAMTDAAHVWRDKSKNQGFPPGCAPL